MDSFFLLFSWTCLSLCSWFSHHLKQGTTKINVAVDKLPQFHCFKTNHAEVGPQHTATIHIGFERYASICMRPYFSWKANILFECISIIYFEP
jgi:hypothetical protein